MNYKLTYEKHIFNFSKSNTVALTVSSGDSIEIETMDCFANQLTTPEDKLESMDWDKVNPASGPIFIREAFKGDTLKVTIENIRLNNQGVMASGKDLGVLGDLLDGLESKLIQIENGKAIFNDKISIPLNPIIGVIGVAPENEAVNCGTPGTHGGNMDNTMIVEGAVLYLPIFVDGALFALGDLHAVMGDSEIGVTGIEIAGTVKVKLDVIKNLIIETPMLENNDYFSTIASSQTLDDAVADCTKHMFMLLSKKLEIPKHELVMLLSVVGHTQICQVVDPLKTARFIMPKWVLEKYKFNIY
ncbi:acetamidase/formamidase family protein [Clostridium sp. YIM B02515]|uniref:Acetamidase/formamidase family protein n=1 Tax=Clostridium rhizosphaerae TaxID=2803861 RepID=A0ABS1TC60_9CLOT|nr:acetamidase/formamidase family protein [Clostridium rhizosphaerae]MBL4936687.1 acetamidase/formamidase family protein [Clostridium rhizosphaerae]